MTIAFVATAYQVVAAGEKWTFVSTWSLDTYEIRNKAGKWVRHASTQLESNPIGDIIDDSTGNMAVQLTQRDRSHIGSKDWNKRRIALGSSNTCVVCVTASLPDDATFQTTGLVVIHPI